MLTLDELRQEPLYQEFDSCFHGEFKRTLTDLRITLTIEDFNLTAAVSLIRKCWEQFEAVHLFAASGMADFLGETYTGTHEPHELEQDFHTLIGLVLDGLEYTANARFTTERRYLNIEGADEARRVLAWITDVRDFLTQKTINNASINTGRSVHTSSRVTFKNESIRLLKVEHTAASTNSKQGE